MHNANRSPGTRLWELVASSIALVAWLGWPLAAHAQHSGRTSAPKPPQMHSTPVKPPQSQFHTSVVHFNAPTTALHGTNPSKLATARLGASKPPHKNGGQPKPSDPNSNPQDSNTNNVNVAWIPALGLFPGMFPYVGGLYVRHAGYGYSYGRGYYHPTYRIYPTTTVNPAMLRFRKLIADLDSITPKTPVTQVQKNILRTDMMAVAERAPKPNTPLVQTLADNLADSLTRRQIPLLDTADLAGDLKVVMNSAYVPDMEVTQAIRQAETILKASRVNQ